MAGQQETGIGVITDGEFRRRDFRTGLVNAVEGMSMVTFDMPWREACAAGVTKLASNNFLVTSRIKQRRRLAEGEAAYVRGLISAPVKVTLIAPGFIVDVSWKDGCDRPVLRLP